MSRLLNKQVVYDQGCLRTNWDQILEYFFESDDGQDSIRIIIFSKSDGFVYP